MKDLIAKLKSDATCAMGALWIHIDSREAHIDAQAARIAELEAQIAAKADTDKLREAILAMPFPDPWGVLRHDADTDKWYEPEDPTAADIRVYSQRDLNEIRVAFADLAASTALQAPVREVPEVNDAKYSDAEKAISKIIFQRYPRIQGHRCASITVGILEYMGLRHSALNYDQQEPNDE